MKLVNKSLFQYVSRPLIVLLTGALFVRVRHADLVPIVHVYGSQPRNMPIESIFLSTSAQNMDGVLS